MNTFNENNNNSTNNIDFNKKNNKPFQASFLSEPREGYLVPISICLGKMDREKLARISNGLSVPETIFRITESFFQHVGENYLKEFNPLDYSCTQKYAYPYYFELQEYKCKTLRKICQSGKGNSIIRVIIAGAFERLINKYNNIIPLVSSWTRARDICSVLNIKEMPLPDEKTVQEFINNHSEEFNKRIEEIGESYKENRLSFEEAEKDLVEQYVKNNPDTPYILTLDPNNTKKELTLTPRGIYSAITSGVIQALDGEPAYASLLQDIIDSTYYSVVKYTCRGIEMKDSFCKKNK